MLHIRKTKEIYRQDRERQVVREIIIFLAFSASWRLKNYMAGIRNVLPIRKLSLCKLLAPRMEAKVT